MTEQLTALEILVVIGGLMIGMFLGYLMGLADGQRYWRNRL